MKNCFAAIKIKEQERKNLNVFRKACLLIFIKINHVKVNNIKQTLKEWIFPPQGLRDEQNWGHFKVQLNFSPKDLNLNSVEIKDNSVVSLNLNSISSLIQLIQKRLNSNLGRTPVVNRHQH